MNTLSADSAKREVKTGHHTYILETLRDGHTMLSGHPQYCPEAVEVGSRGGSGATAAARLPSMVSTPRSRSSAHVSHQRNPRVMSHRREASGLSSRVRVHFPTATSFAMNDTTVRGSNSSIKP